MKKILIFLMAFIGINVITSINVNAESFYEGDYIDGIYVTKEKGGTKYYQKARFFNQSGTGQFSYCVEPFAMFNENGVYTSSITATNLTEEQMDRIKKIIYFGYQYGNHTDPKWYAITQYMVWKESDYSGDIYFTNGLNGNRIEMFQNEIAEINNLINTYQRVPNFANKVIPIVEGETFPIEDKNHTLAEFVSDSNKAKIQENTLTLDNFNEGTYTINFEKQEGNYGKIPLFFNSPTSQNMVIVGDLAPVNFQIHLIVYKTSIEITKIDSDTKTTIPSGEASLSGAIYDLYDSNKNKINELVIGDNMTAKLENLTAGKYYIKEQKPGIGYLLDENWYSFTIEFLDPNAKLTLENKVIKKEIEINKNYGDGTTFEKEEGVHFDILDSKNNVIDTITTNSEGKAFITLPYGKYSLVQKDTKDGYTINEKQEIEVSDEEKLELTLYDYKIKVPNTHTSNSIYYLLIIFIGIIYVKSKVFS